MPVPNRQPPLARIWLVSDARNDGVIAAVLARLPRGAGLIFRHHHLPAGPRRARFRELARAARRHGHAVALAGSVREARRWAADAAYGPPARLARRAPGCRAVLRLATVHSWRELAAAQRVRADAVLLSPVFATRTHPGAATLGTVRFRLMASRALLPAIALGGMDARRARAIGAVRWAAIDGLSRRAGQRPTGMFPVHC